MKRRTFLALALLLAATAPATAQSTIDQVLASIASHNKTIQAQERSLEAQRLGYRTGLNPENPVVGLDYMVGSPIAAGNQTDLTLTQVIDFPTAYARRNALATLQEGMAEPQRIATRREILRQGHDLCIDLVHHQKTGRVLQRRVASMEMLLAALQAKLERGDGNMLDVNKARLQLLDLRLKVQENQAGIERLQAQLASLNGGVAIAFADTLHGPLPILPAFEVLEKEIEEADPMRAAMLQSVAIAKQQVHLSKALKLPRLELGYHYQGILGQTYNGVHTGMTLPLWENRNLTEARQAEVQAAEAGLQEHLNEHYYHVRQLYDRYLSLGASLSEHRSLLDGLSSEALLAKALALGQISLIEYLLEMRYFHDAQDQLLVLERDLQHVVAALLMHRLG